MLKLVLFFILIPILLLIFALIYLPYKLKSLLGIRDKKEAERKNRSKNVNNPNNVNQIKNEDIIDADFEEIDSSDNDK